MTISQQKQIGRLRILSERTTLSTFACCPLKRFLPLRLKTKSANRVKSSRIFQLESGRLGQDGARSSSSWSELLCSEPADLAPQVPASLDRNCSCRRKLNCCCAMSLDETNVCSCRPVSSCSVAPLLMELTVERVTEPNSNNQTTENKYYEYRKLWTVLPSRWIQ